MSDSYEVSRSDSRRCQGTEAGEGMGSNMREKQQNTDQTGEGGCCHRTKERTAAEYRGLINRLSRIEGQVRGIRKMVERDAYCPDILVQVAAVSAALNSFNKELLGNHIRTCVARDIREGKEETIEELMITLQKLMK